MAKNKALSLRSQWLGDRLRAARVRCGLTLEQVAEYLRLDHSSLSRFERGTAQIRPSYIKDLIGYYGISNQRERDALFRLNDDAWRKDWWDGDTADLEMEFIDYTWLEARASRICLYEPILITGLLQTEDYARAVTVAGFGEDAREETIDRMVELRMTRQRILNGENPTGLSVVFEESAIRRPVGSLAVHKGQLRRLLDAALLEHIDIRILPVTVGWHRGWAGPFTVFEMPDPYPHVAYLEGLVSRTFLEEEDKVTTFRHAYDDLHRAALTPRESNKFIESVLKDLE